MTPEEVREEVERIRQVAGDDERAHSAEDRLHYAVLAYVADGDWIESDPLAVRDLAREAIRTQQIDFERWCA